MPNDNDQPSKEKYEAGCIRTRLDCGELRNVERARQGLEIVLQVVVETEGRFDAKNKIAVVGETAS